MVEELKNVISKNVVQFTKRPKVDLYCVSKFEFISHQSIENTSYFYF